MIHATCFTNLDGYERETWPTMFVEIPRVGEWVESDSGKSLRVVQITHRMGKPLRRLSTEPRPEIRVELHR